MHACDVSRVLQLCARAWGAGTMHDEGDAHEISSSRGDVVGDSDGLMGTST